MPFPSQSEAAAALSRVHDAAVPYLESLATRPVTDAAARGELARLGGALPESGLGADAVIETLLEVGIAAGTASAGPRYFHFVTGGVTPAALAADWTASLLDQNVSSRASSAFATEAETVALDWLRDLAGLPRTYGGVLVTSATLANFAGLGAATGWWGQRHGVDTAVDGLSGLPKMPVLSSGYLHQSPRKALQMLGHGRKSPEIYALDPTGRADLDAMRRRLDQLDGAPAVLIATAGEVNAGQFDPIGALADLAEQYGCWLHVDAAFGFFAAVSPRTRHLIEGLERADSIAADGHKWLNVPYESGFVLVRDPRRLTAAFGTPGAAYLPGPDDPDSGYGPRGPEASRRARALPIWATLAAYGREGHRELVERHLDLAQRLARGIDEAPGLERLADSPLCVVCFRANVPGIDDLDDLNRRLGAALLADGRVAAGTTVYAGRVALRPAIVNWRTTGADIDLFVTVVREILAAIQDER